MTWGMDTICSPVGLSCFSLKTLEFTRGGCAFTIHCFHQSGSGTCHLSASWKVEGSQNFNHGSFSSSETQLFNVLFDLPMSPMESLEDWKGDLALSWFSWNLIVLGWVSQGSSSPGRSRVCPLMRVWRNRIRWGIWCQELSTSNQYRNYFLTPADHTLFCAAATSLNRGLSFQQEKVNISIWAFKHLQDGFEAWVFYWFSHPHAEHRTLPRIDGLCQSKLTSGAIYLQSDSQSYQILKLKGT